MKITFLGGGNMATALIGGMLERGFAAADLQVVELGEAARGALAQRFGVRAVAAFDDAALACDVLVLAVKPQQMKAALAPIAGRLGGQLVLSIAAGLRLADLGRWLGAPGAPHAFRIAYEDPGFAPKNRAVERTPTTASSSLS